MRLMLMCKMGSWITSVVLKLERVPESTGGLVKMQITGSQPPPPRFGRAWAGGLISCLSNRVMLMLLVQGHTLRISGFVIYLTSSSVNSGRPGHALSGCRVMLLVAVVA